MKIEASEHVQNSSATDEQVQQTVEDMDLCPEEELGDKKWTPREDEILKQIVAQLSPKKWTKICNRFNELAHEGQSIKQPLQCRERWLNHVNPDLQKGRWSLDEDVLILEGQLKYGNSWSKIAKGLSSRNQNSVKNRWNAMVKKFKKETGSDDIQLLIDEKQQQKEREACQIVPVPVPVFQDFQNSSSFFACGVLRSDTSSSSTTSTESSGDEDRAPQIPFETGGKPIYDVVKIKDFSCPPPSAEAVYGIFIPISHLPHLQNFAIGPLGENMRLEMMKDQINSVN